MSKLLSYSGSIAVLDLSTKTITIQDTPSFILPKVIGGKGLGAWLLYKYLKPGTDPLSPENPLIFATGPAQAVLPIAGRHTVVTKSPLTGLYLDSHSGGQFGAMLKKAGFDALVILGKASSWTRIQITDHDIQFLDAEDLVGKTTHETEDFVKAQHGPRASVTSIGVAGENKVLFSALINDYYRAIGRGGIGAVFASKHLKAISVLGSAPPSTVSDPRVKEERSFLNQRARKNRENKHKLYYYGTSWLVPYSSGLGQLPVLNYSRTESEHAEDVEGVAIEKAFENTQRPKPCYQCSIGCSFVITKKESWSEKPIQHPEYESIALLGTNLGIYDPKAITRLNYECNIHGLDTISTGSVLGWFMESTEKGVLPAEYAHEGVRFGDVDGALELIRKIARREGVGNILADGVRRASKVFGKGSEQWAVHVKGLELPAWDPRGRLGMGLSYAVTPVGGSHLRGWPETSDPPNKSATTIIPGLVRQQNLKILKDSLIMCHFTHSINPALNIEDTARIYSTLTGLNVTLEDMNNAAHNIWLLTRLINEREFQLQGTAPRDHDVLPPRLMKEPAPSGRAKGLTAFVSPQDFELSLTKYYETRGLQEDGSIPESTKQALLEDLSLL